MLVLIPEGTFQMGARRPTGDQLIPDEPNEDPHTIKFFESPVHTAFLPAFFLSKFEMTQGQWKNITGKNPSWPTRVIRADHPVNRVNWVECDRMTRRLGLRLPSEAQWEYAARAGSDTVWFTGNEERSLQGFANLFEQTSKEKSPKELLEPDGLFPLPFGFFWAHEHAQVPCSLEALVADIRFGATRKLNLKGIPEPQSVFEVEWKEPAE